MAAARTPASTLAEGATPTAGSCGFGVDLVHCPAGRPEEPLQCAPVSKSGTSGSVRVPTGGVSAWTATWMPMAHKPTRRQRQDERAQHRRERQARMTSPIAGNPDYHCDDVGRIRHAPARCTPPRPSSPIALPASIAVGCHDRGRIVYDHCGYCRLARHTPAWHLDRRIDDKTPLTVVRRTRRLRR